MTTEPDPRLWILGTEETASFAARRRPEDFRVEELPAAPPEGVGEHLSLWIEKRSLSTPEAQARLASHFGVERRSVGRAGLKDADAVTRQELSIHDPEQRLDPAAIEGLELGGLEVLRATRRQRSLRPGDLAGNRFTLRLRDVESEGTARLAKGLASLARIGVPARFGPQRFGHRGDGARLGIALLRGDDAQVVALACGRPSGADQGRVLEARQLFDAGDARAAADRFPPSYGVSARLARAYARNRSRASNALRSLPLADLTLWIHAAQSEVFNRIVDERAPDLDRLLDGDVLRPIDGSRDRVIEDAAAWQPAADRFELSPTGLMPGAKVPLAGLAAGEAEARAFASLGLDPAVFDRAARYRVPGARRPLRLRLSDPTAWGDSDEHGAYTELHFSLPPGGYASTVLEELARGRVSW